MLKNDLFGNDPVTKYVLDHSLRLHPAQEKLIEVLIYVKIALRLYVYAHVPPYVHTNVCAYMYV